MLSLARAASRFGTATTIALILCFTGSAVVICDDMGESEELEAGTFAGGRVADLVPVDIWTDPANPVGNQPVTVYTQVSNIGLKTVSDPFVNTLYVDGAIVATQQLTRLRAGEVGSEFSGTILLSPGNHTLMCFADSGSAIKESQESNNVLSEVVPWAAGPDLIVTSADPIQNGTSSANLSSGLRFDVNVTIMNIGDERADSGSIVRLSDIYESTETVLGTETVGYVEPGASVVTTFSGLSLAELGSRTLKASADATNKIWETNDPTGNTTGTAEENNDLFQSIDVSPLKWLTIGYCAYDVSDLDDLVLTESMAYKRILSPLQSNNPSLRYCAEPSKDIDAVVLIDRYYNWYYNSNARIYEVTNHSYHLKEDCGELNTGDPQTLSNFIIWCIERFKAERYNLVLYGHGLNYIGLGEDMNPVDYLSLPELKTAFAEVESTTGITMEVLAFEACQMNAVEVAFQLQDFAKVMVAGEAPINSLATGPTHRYIIENPDCDETQIGQVYVDETYVARTAPYVAATNLSYMDLLASGIQALGSYLVSAMVDPIGCGAYSAEMQEIRDAVSDVVLPTMSTADLGDLVRRCRDASISGALPNDQSAIEAMTGTLATIEEMTIAFRAISDSLIYDPNATGMTIVFYGDTYSPWSSVVDYYRLLDFSQPDAAFSWTEFGTAYNGLLLVETFDDSNLSDWIVNSSGGSIAIAPSLGWFDEPSLEVFKEQAAGSAVASHELAEVTSGLVEVSANVMVDTAATDKWCYFNVYGGGVMQTHFLLKDGQMAYYDPVQEIYVGVGAAYAANTWYRIGFVVDLDGGTYEIRVNGVMKKSNVPLCGVAHSVDSISFQAGTPDDIYGVTLWADDIKVSVPVLSFSDCFTDGDIDDWTVLDSGGSVGINFTVGEEIPPSLQIFKHHIAGGCAAHHSFEPTAGRVIAEAYLMVDTSSIWKWCYFNVYGGGAIQTYFGFVDGYMRYYDGVWHPIGVYYVPWTWYLVRLDVSLWDGTYDIYVNGILRKAGAPLWGDGPHVADSVGFQAGTWNDLYGVTLWVDDVSVVTCR